VGQQPGAVGRGVAQQGGDPVAFGAQLPLAHLAQGQRCGGIDGQALAAVAAGDGGELVVDAAGSGLGTSSSSSTARGSGLTTSKKVVCLAARVAAT
jgi:hypothetical protein